MIRSHATPESTCSACGLVLNMSRAADGNTNPPQPGDVTLCARCGTLYRFDEDVALERVSEAEEASLSESDRARVASVRAALFEARSAQEPAS